MSFVNTRYLIKLITRYQINIFTLQHRHLHPALVTLKPNRCLWRCAISVVKKLAIKWQMTKKIS